MSDTETVRVGYQLDTEGVPHLLVELHGQQFMFDRRNARIFRDNITQALIVIGEADLLQDATVEQMIGAIRMDARDPTITIGGNSNPLRLDAGTSVVVEWGTPDGFTDIHFACNDLRAGLMSAIMAFHDQRG